MKLVKHGCDLKSCFFCTGCLPEWLAAADTRRKTFHLKKGELLFAEGNTVTGVYFVNDGKLKVHKKWGNDKELIIRFANKGAIVGHRGLGSENIYPVSATAIEASTVCFIDLDFFTASLKVNHQLTFDLMMFFADELKLSEKKMRNLAHMNVKGRVAQSLLSLKNIFGTNSEGAVDITLSRQDLASFSGTTYETVFRILNELTQEGTIKLSGKNIVIVDEAKLISFTEETDS